MRRFLLALLGVAAVLAFVAVVALPATQGRPAARERLDHALGRMEATAVRLRMDAVAEARGSRAMGGSFSQRIRATGELVPPDRLHLVLEGAGRVQEMTIVGKRMWIDAGEGMRIADKVPLGPLTRPTAPLDLIKGRGVPEFAGLGLARWVVTYRVRIPLDALELQDRVTSDHPVDPDTIGLVEVEIGLFDGLIHRETFSVQEPADPFGGTGLETVRTSYTIEYWDHGSRLEVREPEAREPGP